MAESQGKILILDDDPNVAEQLKQLLSEEGFEISFIMKGDFLFKRLEAETFDLLLLDLNLPGTSGLNLLAEIKQSDQHKDLNVIMITGEDERSTIQACYEKGATDFIPKPINEASLKARVKSAIQAKRYQEQQLQTERQKTMQSQLMMLSAQMNPHFIFNSLNAIQYYVLNNDSENALTFTSEFSSLMRRTLEYSQRAFISIEEEIRFLTDYLSLEKERFPDVFDFAINSYVDDEINVPPMLLQPYIENAIIHGFKHLDRKGNLTVNLVEEEDVVVCTIRDNGVGREKGKEQRSSIKEHKSHAMSNTANRLQLLKNTHGTDSFSVQINDLEENEKPSGTEIIITFTADLH